MYKPRRSRRYKICAYERTDRQTDVAGGIISVFYRYVSLAQRHLYILCHNTRCKNQEVSFQIHDGNIYAKREDLDPSSKNIHPDLFFFLESHLSLFFDA